MTKTQFHKALNNGREGRTKILKSAADVFVRKGYHQTTVDEIAQAMRVAKGTIYNHFAGKEDLYMAVIRRGVDLLQERLKQAAARGKNAREKIMNLIGSQLHFFEQEKDLVLLFLTEFFGRDAHRGRLAAEMLSGCLEIIRSVIAEGIGDGTLREIDLEIATSSLFGMVTTTAFHFISQDRPINYDAVCAGIGKIFFEGTCRKQAAQI